MKNIDKIRKMPAEELATKIFNTVCCGFCVFADCKEDCKKYHCVFGIKQWLEQEASE